MSRKVKILLGVLIPIVVIAGGLGGFALWNYWPAVWSSAPPEMAFSIEDPDVIHILGGFREETHNGIDYGCNTSVNVLAWCKLRVTGIRTWFNERGGHWQTNVHLQYNWKYNFEICFEPWALNETYGNIQADAIAVKVGQIINQGEIIGLLLYQGSGTHIHFGMKENGNSICPYQFLNTEAKELFDTLWAIYGDGDICD